MIAASTHTAVDTLLRRIGQVRDERLVVRPLGHFRRIAVCSSDDRRGRALTHPSELRDCPCLVFSGARASGQWRFERVGADGQASAEEGQVTVPVSGPVAVRSFATVLRLATLGMGVAYIPEFVARPAIAAGRVRRCLSGWHSRRSPVALAYRAGASKIRRVRTVLDAAREFLPGLLDAPG